MLSNFATIEKPLCKPELDERKMIFKKELYRILQLISINNLPDIPCKVLNKPKKQNKTYTADFIKKNDLKTIMISNALEKLEKGKIYNIN